MIGMEHVEDLCACTQIADIRLLYEGIRTLSQDGNAGLAERTLDYALRTHAERLGLNREEFERDFFETNLNPVVRRLVALWHAYISELYEGGYTSPAEEQLRVLHDTLRDLDQGDLWEEGVKVARSRIINTIDKGAFESAVRRFKEAE